MGKIFDAPANISPAGGGGRRAAAGDAGGSGEGLQAFGSSIVAFGDEIQAREEREDVTRAQTMRSAAMANLDGLSTEMERVALPGAPDHVKNSQQAVKDYYASQPRATTAKGQQVRALQEAEMLSHFTIQSSTFQAAAVGKKVKLDFTASSQTDRNVITASANPEAAHLALLQPQIDKINDPNGVLYGGLKGDAARAALTRETQEDYTEALVIGLIRQNPEAAKARLEAGSFSKTLPPEDVERLIKEANTAISADETDARLAATNEEKAVKKARDATEMAFSLRIGTDNPPTTREIMTSNMSLEAKKSLTNFLEGRINSSTPGMLNRVAVDILEGVITTREQLHALVGQGLGFTDFNAAATLLADADGPKGKQQQIFLKQLIRVGSSAHGASNEGLNWVNPQGDARQLAWLQEMIPRWFAAIERGVPASALVDKNDKKNYLGFGITGMSAAEIMRQSLIVNSPPPPVTGGKRPEGNLTKRGTEIYTNRIVVLIGDKWYYEDNYTLVE